MMGGASGFRLKLSESMAFKKQFVKWVLRHNLLQFTSLIYFFLRSSIAEKSSTVNLHQWVLSEMQTYILHRVRKKVEPVMFKA